MLNMRLPFIVVRVTPLQNPMEAIVSVSVFGFYLASELPFFFSEVENEDQMGEDFVRPSIHTYLHHYFVDDPW